MDTTVVAPNVTRKGLDWRSILFAGVTGLLGLFFLFLALSMNPWTGSIAPRPGYTPGLHIWHEAEGSSAECSIRAMSVDRDLEATQQAFAGPIFYHHDAFAYANC